jgi:tetratricopeptide (TPR) repeat protein
MMKKFILPVAITGLLLSACTNPTPVAENQKKTIPAEFIEEKIYKQALEFEDLSTAIFAIHSMMAKDSAQAWHIDSLASHYFKNMQLPESVKAAEKILAANPENLEALRILASAQQTLGKHESAIGHFTTLYDKTNKFEYLYKIGITQMGMNRIKEATGTVSLLLKHPDINKDSVDVLATQGERQQVPAKAAVYNLRGVIYLQGNKLQEARKDFREAVKIYPDFVMAGTYLNELEMYLNR